MASCLAVVGLVFTVLTLIGASISLGTPFWIEGPGFHAGLWQQCQNNSCEFIKFNATGLPTWYNPVRIVMSVSVANAVVALAVTIGYLSCGWCKHSIRALQFLILVLLTGTLELICCVVVYLVKHDDVSFYTGRLPVGACLGWSFYMAAASVLTFIVNIILMVCETSNSGSASTGTKYPTSKIGYQPVS